MLYVVTAIITLVWGWWLIIRQQIGWHRALIIYAVTLVPAKTADVLFAQVLKKYQFVTGLISAPQDNQLGVIFSDGLILPVMAIIFCWYVTRFQPLRVVLSATGAIMVLEWVYVHLGFLHYVQWSAWVSACFYLLGFSALAYFAPRLMGRGQISYAVRLLGLTYTSLVWPGTFVGGVLLNLYQWSPGLFADPAADDRVAELGLALCLALLTALAAWVAPLQRRQAAVMLLALAVCGFAVFAHARGWLVYHRWNDWLSVIRYGVPYALVIAYDRWATTAGQGRYLTS